MESAQGHSCAGNLNSIVSIIVLSVVFSERKRRHQLGVIWRVYYPLGKESVLTLKLQHTSKSPRSRGGVEINAQFERQSGGSSPTLSQGLDHSYKGSSKTTLTEAGSVGTQRG